MKCLFAGILLSAHMVGSTREIPRSTEWRFYRPEPVLTSPGKRAEDADHSQHLLRHLLEQ